MPLIVEKGAVTSSGKQTVARLQMDIITAMIGFFPFGVDITSKMVFIWSFVLREAGIPIDTVGTLFGFYTTDAFIEQGNTGDDSRKQLFELITGNLVLIPMGIEPFSIIVYGQFF